MFVTTNTISGCSKNRSGRRESAWRTSSTLISLPTTVHGMWGNTVCIRLKTWVSTEASPIPASNTRNPGWRIVR